MTFLYNDTALLQPVHGQILSEGRTYYLDISQFSKSLVQRWLEEEYIFNSIINYNSKNFIQTIRFDNVVGNVNILGINYDVRSEKLMDGTSGNQQFQQLLDEINAISTKLNFSFRGVTYAHRKSDYSFNDNILEILDYYYQLVFMFPSSDNLDALLMQCFKHPHTTNRQVIEKIDFSKSTKIAQSFYTQLSTEQNWGIVRAGQTLANSTLAVKTFQRTGQYLLPLQIANLRFISTTNTVENRFVKFFLEDIQSVCLRVLTANVGLDIQNKAKRLQLKVHFYLHTPFFKEIQRLSYVPSSSSVLLRKSGYKEIYYHFVQSKFSFRPILEDMRRQALRAGLKNIATLYELWVFFKIAENLFENKTIQETFHGRNLKNGEMVGGYTWEADQYQLSYNKTYTHNNLGSYSVNLRPDISFKKEGKLHLFDAKYKFNSNSSEGDVLVRVVKPEDIHKMHAYLDAINSAQTAIVIYPGTEYIFYDRSHILKTTIGPINDLNGVGALPLLPNQGAEGLRQLLEIEL